MDIPVYLFTGFLESGKTSFINDTLQDQDFVGNEKTLLIVCEEGEVEYDEVDLAGKNIDIITVEDEDSLTEEFLQQCNVIYHPERVLVEYNGTWKVADFLEMDFPKDWVVVQIISTVDATTYDMYMGNMRSMILEQLTYSDLVVFNRCDETTKKGAYRRGIKAVNRKGQVVFEAKDGTPMEDTDEDLPYDLKDSVIELEDDDFGIWYMDALDHPKKYDGKKIRFKAVVYKSKHLASNNFVPGRFAMTCCADDIAFIGFVCNYNQAQTLPLKAWVYVEADIRVEYRKEYKGKGIVLYANNVTPTTQPEEKLVYFN